MLHVQKNDNNNNNYTERMRRQRSDQKIINWSSSRVPTY